MHLPSLIRRRLLASAAAAALATPAWAQRGSPVLVAQLFDTSPREQDVAKDFLNGSRAAWQEINAQGGLRGRQVVHQPVEVDGANPESLRQAWRALKDNNACVALSGTASDPLASQLTALLAQENAGIAHAAPWLQNSSQEIGDATFPIFAGRREQIEHALKSLSVMGIAEVGAVYAAPRDFALQRDDVTRIAADFKLKLSDFQAHGDLARLGQRLGPNSPALLLFMGGTPELLQFTQGLQRQARQRYVIALADVNLQTLQQMGGGKSTPIIATQAVPMATAALPVVRRYRDAMARLFDEPPAALSLAGYIAARYTYEVLAGVDGQLTRASALSEFRRRAEVDLGGYRVRFDASRRSTTFVTQSMLTADGRVVG
ncbi:ABC transporter substrate-binding protein [Ramlibacter sp. G-1-2-2]|uniref:ABC transporter substrate-binding protein n=1 Tax=Ramlibacter agri TaxID=2728837 RepID=A0A848H4K2_9BURK|nr:ABC transporter substrate-binding protein [Ramlibacter agri]NML45484.1 ABC transporter substrate-binding protein [Ramlibacter agri]